MNARWLKFRDDLRHGDPGPLEWFFASFKIAWGSWLLLSFHTFSVSPHLYRYIAILPESFYGTLWLVLGGLQFRAYFQQNRLARWRLSLIGAFLWIWYGVMLWWGDPRSPALVTFGVMVIFKLFTAYWLSPRRTESE